jgi:thiamine-phosphate pyrophosphorylase
VTKEGKKKVDFRLLVITDRKLCRNLPEKISQACNAGIKAVLIREKDISRDGLINLIKKIKPITSKSNTKLFIHNMTLTTFLLGADGNHLSEKELLHLSTTIIGMSNFISGVSVHSVKNAIKAEKLGFDYILFGPVFQTPAKIKYGSPQGLARLKDVCSSVNIPVFAVGGITPQRVKKCLSSGAHGVAVIGAIMKSTNIKKTANEFKAELGTL